jgi:hypothetical protein
MSIKRPVSSQCSPYSFSGSDFLFRHFSTCLLCTFNHIFSFNLAHVPCGEQSNTLRILFHKHIGRTDIEGSKKQRHYHALSLRVNSLQRMHILQQTRTWIILNNTNIVICILHNQYIHNSSRGIKCNNSIIGFIYNCSIWNNKGIEIRSTNRAL